jgi:hypothetical protein
MGVKMRKTARRPIEFLKNDGDRGARKIIGYSLQNGNGLESSRKKSPDASLLNGRPDRDSGNGFPAKCEF